MSAFVNRSGAMRAPLLVSSEDVRTGSIKGSGVLAAPHIDDPQYVVTNGTGGNDTLTGTAGDDTLNGLAGDDVLEGRGGADSLNGGDGNDTVTYANAGSAVSVFISGGGSPTGEAVGDTYTSIENIIGSAFGDYLSGNGQNNRLYGGGGDDSLYGFGSAGSTTYLYGQAGLDTLIGSAGIDIIDGGTEENTVSYYLSPVGLTISLTNQSVNTGWAAGDTYANIADVVGSNFNDIIYGGVGGVLNQLQGQSGNDIIYGGSSAYTVLIGGVGADELHAGSGGNLIDYETATSGVTASMENSGINTGDAQGDTYVGLFGRDLAGSPYDDILYGDAGNNNLIGDPELVIYLHAGVDQLHGGSGDDTLDGGPNGDLLDGGIGIDAAAYQSALSGVQAFLGNSGANTGDAAGDSYVNVEGLIGSNFGDVLGGDALNNSLFGYAGADTLQGGAGDDLLVGGMGADTLQGGDGTDLAVYSDSTEAVQINMASPQFNVGAVAVGDTYNGVEGVFGSAYGDIINGDQNANILRGEGGNDTLNGQGGDDTLIGGAGNDALDGGAGFNIASYSTAAAGVVASLTSPGSNTGEAAGDTYANIQQLNGSGFADTLTAISANGGVLRGLGGNDVLNATAFGAQLNGDEGDDILNGGSGDDVLLGGSGADQIKGAGGTDLVSYVTSTAGVTLSLISGGTGGDAAGDTFSDIENVAGSHLADTITGNALANYILGLEGNDTLSGGDGDDVLEGGLGSDTIQGGAGYDYATYGNATTGVTASLVGGAEAGEAAGDVFTSIEGLLGSAFGDILTGDGGNNTIQGYAGNDTLDGGAATDFLLGGDGADTIIGGAGNDSLTGGAGADTFLFRSVSESFESTTVASDVIEDFQTGIDKIDISAFQPTSTAITTQGEFTYVTAQSSSGVFTVRVRGPVAAGDLILTATGQQIAGTAGADTLVGTNGADVLVGNGGGDSLTGGAGADTFRYVSRLDSTAAAQDVIQDFTTGSDRLDLASVNTSSVSIIRDNSGNSFIFAQTPAGDPQMQIAVVGAVNASDVVYNNLHGIYMIGSGLSETLIGSALNDPLQGNGGDDILIGGVGGDAISGGAGADRFVYRSTSESVADGGRYDNLYDFQTGVDVIDMTAINTSTISIIRSGGSSFVFSDTAQGAFQLIAAGREINGNDFLYNNAHGIYLVGSSAAESLIGSANNDSIQGGDGADLLVGGLGGDAISGGAGADNFYYRSVAESTATNNAYDNLYDFQSGTDKIDLTALNTTSISVIRSGGSSFVFAQAPGGNFQLISAGQLLNGDDFTYASSHGIFLVGTADNETFRGSVKADSIQGGDGADILIGGLGGDALDGGAGADTYRYVSANDSTSSDSDRILSFTTGVDKLDLSAVRTGAADQINILYSGGGSFIFVDLGGNGTNDLVIQSTAVINMTDIVWTAPTSPLEAAGKGAEALVIPQALAQSDGNVAHLGLQGSAGLGLSGFGHDLGLGHDGWMHMA